jgi:dimethylargininase
MLLAMTRPPTAALERCALTHLEREPIDIDRAIAQHRRYEETLARLGAEVISLPPEQDLPDAVFVEDVALVLDEVGVVTRPGTPSRLPEVATVEERLAAYRPLLRIEAPGTLDGGDVMRVDRVLYVGRSGRTNQAGIAALARAVGPFGYEVRPVPVTGCLHLKSACSHLGGGLVLVNKDWIEADALREVELLDVPAAHPGSANSFLVGDTVVMAAGFPETAALVRATGRTVETVELSELRKAEAGGSCMSLVFEA